MKKSLFVAIISFVPVYALAADPHYIKEIKLQQLEDEAIRKSHEIRSKKLEVEAYVEKRQSVTSSYIPKITLDGFYRYLKEIPTLDLAPGRELSFGDNNNYSLGPTLNMAVFDFGARSETQKSIDATVNSKKFELAALTENILQKTRFHYVNLILLSDRQELISESLKLAQDQLKDVEYRSRFGSGTKVDLLTARREVHELMTQFKELQALMSAELTEIQQLIGNMDLIGISSPISLGAENKLFESQNYLNLDDYAEVNKKLAKYEHLSIRPLSHPRIKALNEMATSQELSAEAIKSTRWPKLSLYARASFDYPNGPIREEINQNIIGVNLTMPIFDGGEIRHSIQEKYAFANSLKAQSLHEEKSIVGLHALSLEKIRNLREQRMIIQKKIDEAKQISDLMYQSYKDGQLTFIEVERANFKYREAKLHQSFNQFHILNHLIILAELSGESYENK